MGQLQNELPVKNKDTVPSGLIPVFRGLFKHMFSIKKKKKSLNPQKTTCRLDGFVLEVCSAHITGKKAKKNCPDFVTLWWNLM